MEESLGVALPRCYTDWFMTARRMALQPLYSAAEYLLLSGKPIFLLYAKPSTWKKLTRLWPVMRRYDDEVSL